MMPEPQFLFAAPVLLLGAAAVVVIASVLALTRNWRRLVAGVVGALCGYVALGTELGRELYDGAIERGACPDVGWLGPTIGAFFCAFVGVIAYETIRSRKATRGGQSNVAVR